MNIDACYRVGHILRKHGTRGEVSVFLDVDYPEDYQKLDSIFLSLDESQQLIPFNIEAVSIHGQKAIIKFEDINSIEEAEDLKSASLYLPLDQLPELKHDQFYFHEILGFQVVDANLGKLGTVKDIYNLPNNDLIGMQYQGKEILIPVKDEVVKKVDRENKQLEVSLPDGLLDIYLE